MVKSLFWIVGSLVVLTAVAETVKVSGKRPANMALPMAAPAAKPLAEEKREEKPAKPAKDKGALQMEEAVPVQTPPDQGHDAAELNAGPNMPPQIPATAPENLRALSEMTPKPAGNDGPGAVPPAAGTEQMLSRVLDELGKLRQQVLKLQQTLDAHTDSLLVQLQKENQQLRDQLKESYKARQLTAPVVPTPDSALLEQVLQPQGAQEESAIPDAAGPVDGQKALEPEIVAEWGRSPEDAKGATTPVTSLKGMICHVVPGASDEALAALGRSLRKKYDEYDNINIEVFDSEKAAVEYKRGKPPGDHRVLSISKHKETNRDVILLIRGEFVQEIPPAPPEPPPDTNSR